MLDELAGALDLLRGRDENAPTSPVGPSEELTALVHTARAAGLQVTLDAPVLIAPQDVRAATYRIVQEGLTNARRHSPGAAVRIQVQRTGDGVQVSIDNDAAPSPAPASPGSGRGLPGMRERAEALGGTLDAGPTPGGGYRVLVRLPDGGTR